MRKHYSVIILSITSVPASRIKNAPSSGRPSLIDIAARAMTPPTDTRDVATTQMVNGIRIAHRLRQTNI